MPGKDERTPLMTSGDSGTYSSVEEAGAVDVENRRTTQENIEDVPKQGALVTIFALWSSMMGTSLLAMPWAFQQAGIIQGILLQVLLAALAAYTGILILKICTRFVDKDTGVMPEFAIVCKKLMGRWGTILTTQCSIIVFVGALIVYWILMSELLYNSVNSIHYFTTLSHEILKQNNSQGNQTGQGELRILLGDLDVSSLNETKCPARDVNITDNMSPIPAWSENHTVPFFLVLLFAPLIQLRSASFFTRFGAVGCVPVIFLVMYSIIKSAVWGINIDFYDETSVNYAELFSGNFPALSGVMSMAFFTHNAIITFMRYAERPEKNVQNLSISFLLVMLTYATIGISIYIGFPDEKFCIKQNFFENISLTDTLSLVSQLMLFFRLVTLFPLAAYILRVQIFLPVTGKEYPGHLSVGILNVIVVALCVFCAVFYPNIGDIVRYAGAFCGMIYMFLLPCLLEAMLQRKEEKRDGLKPNYAKHILHLVIALFGVANFCAQFAVTS